MLLNVYSRFPVNFVKGEGLELIDDKGERYLDFVSGIAVNALGHAHPKMVASIQEQAKNLLHVSNLYHNEAQTKLAKRLTESTGYDRVFFCNSGAEANEVALKIARKFGRKIAESKTKILYMKDSFHGRTTGTLAVTGQEKYQADYRPLMPNTFQVEYNNLADLEEHFDDDVCAIILEPIQGEGGLASATPEFLAKIKALKEKHNALVIFDEIQCGLGRTGTLLYSDQLDLKADVVTLAKALGGGVPIGACMTKDRANEVLTPGDHGSTYGGNPFVCSVAYTVLGELTQDALLENVRNMGQYAANELLKLKEKHPELKGVRGKGLLLGFQLSESLNAGDFVKKALEHKLLLVAAGGNVVRFFPALIVTQAEIDHAITLLDSVFTDLKSY